MVVPWWWLERSSVLRRGDLSYRSRRISTLISSLRLTQSHPHSLSTAASRYPPPRGVAGRGGGGGRRASHFLLRGQVPPGSVAPPVSPAPPQEIQGESLRRWVTLTVRVKCRTRRLAGVTPSGHASALPLLPASPSVWWTASRSPCPSRRRTQATGGLAVSGWWRRAAAGVSCVWAAAQ